MLSATSCHLLHEALFNPETCTSIQKHPFHSANLNSEMPADSQNAFLHWGDVFGFTVSHALPKAMHHTPWLASTGDNKSAWETG